MRRTSSRRRKSAAPQPFRPRVERLEDRIALAIFTVNSLDDTNARDDVLTLREAIPLTVGVVPNTNGLTAAERAQINADASPDRHIIRFGVTGTILVGSTGLRELPAIIGTSRPVHIDGGSPGRVVLDGSAAPDFALVYGLATRTLDTRVTDLVITGFRTGIGTQYGLGTVIQNNYLGTDRTGTALGAVHPSIQSGGGVGVAVEPGVSSPDAVANRIIDNVISGWFVGVELRSNTFGVPAGVPGNVVQGNLIGTDRTGTAVLGNLGAGIFVEGSGNLIGGTALGTGNVIAGIQIVDRIVPEHLFGAGIQIGMQPDEEDAPRDNVVQGNFIGTDMSGLLPLANVSHGIRLDGAVSTTIGGTEPGAGNTITNNGLDGVSVRGGAQNAILGNAIYLNNGLGIDLVEIIGDPPFGQGIVGPTANDAGDADTGSNLLQNHPELVAVNEADGNLTIHYRVPSTTSNSAYPLRIEFFQADALSQEGESFLGADTYFAGEAGQLKTVFFETFLRGRGVTATATDAQGNTSEFSPRFGPPVPPPLGSAPAYREDFTNDLDRDVGGFDTARDGLLIQSSAVRRHFFLTTALPAPDLSAPDFYVLLLQGRTGLPATYSGSVFAGGPDNDGDGRPDDGGLLPGEVANAASVNVRGVGTITFVGTGSSRTMTAADLGAASTWLTASVDAETLGDDGVPLGPLVQVRATTTATLYLDDVTFVIGVDAPVAATDIYNLAHGARGPFAATAANGVLANDSDPGGNPLTVTLAQAPANGQVQLNPNGSFTYTSNRADGRIVSDEFFYNLHNGVSTPVRGQVVIAMPNATPIGKLDVYRLPHGTIQPLTIEKGVLEGVVFNFEGRDTDADGDFLTVTLAEAPVNGQVILNANGSFRYTANGAGLFPGDDFSYDLHDGFAPPVRVQVRIRSANEAPVAYEAYEVSEIDGVTIRELEGPGAIFVQRGRVAPFEFAGQSRAEFVIGHDEDGDALSPQLLTQPVHGVVTFSSEIDGTGRRLQKAIYEIPSGQPIKFWDTFRFRLTDEYGAVNEGEIVIHTDNLLLALPSDDFFHVRQVPEDTPQGEALPEHVARFGSALLRNDGFSLDGELPVNPFVDFDSDRLQAELVTGPRFGNLLELHDGANEFIFPVPMDRYFVSGNIRPDGSFIYYPDVARLPNGERERLPFLGVDTFTYRITDGDTVRDEHERMKREERAALEGAPVEDPYLATVSIDLHANDELLPAPQLGADKFNFDFPDREPFEVSISLESILQNDANLIPNAASIIRFFAISDLARSFLDLPAANVIVVERPSPLSVPFDLEGFQTGIFELAYTIQHEGFAESAPARLTIEVRDIDRDGDGVGDAEERRNGVEGQNTADLVAIDSPLGEGGIVLFVGGEREFRGVRVTSSPPAAGLPDDVRFPVGFLDFGVVGASGVTQVFITLPAGASADSYWKFGPELDNLSTPDVDETNLTPHWWNFTFDPVSGTGARIDGNVIMLNLRDNERGDDDPETGFIGDPGAPALLPEPPRVESLVVNDGSIQRKTIGKIAVAFSTEVTIDAGAIELRSPKGVPVGIAVSTSVENNKTHAVITFPGGPLRAGQYTLTIDSAGIFDIFAQELDGNHDGVGGDDHLAELAGKQYIDQDGDTYTVTLKGPGQAFVVTQDPEGDLRGPIQQIIVQNTDPAKSTLTIAVKKGKQGDGRVTIGSILGTGLKAISAKKSDLVGGPIGLSGHLGSLTIGAVLNGADIGAAAGTAKQTTKIIAGQIGDGSTVDIGSAIASFTAVAMGDGVLMTPAIGTLAIKGDAKAGIAGNFNADLTLTGNPEQPISLKSAKIKGGISNSTWLIKGDIASLAIAAAVIDWELRLDGSVTSGKFAVVSDSSLLVSDTVRKVAVQRFLNSRLFAGFVPDDADNPRAGGDFSEGTAIVSFTASGQPRSPLPAFVNSNLAASLIGTVALQSVEPDNGAATYGIVADVSIKGVTVKSPRFAFDRDGAEVQVLEDFEVSII